jgi:hypothetical protein
MPKPYAQALCLNPLPKPYAQKGTDLGWGCKDCSDADIECSKRTCTTVCQNGPRVGQSCTVGTAYVCQGGTERDGQFCPDPAAPTECGSMRQGTCDWECPPGDCPPGETCSGEAGECESELSYCYNYRMCSLTIECILLL